MFFPQNRCDYFSALIYNPRILRNPSVFNGELSLFESNVAPFHFLIGGE
jgi:hypothetical protein